MSTERMDVYQEVTNRIVAALEAGTVPWKRPWVASAEAHRNPVSGTEYRGINPFLLDMTAWENGYTAPLWLTFKQAFAKGGCVRKGEKSTLVIFWKMFTGTDDETGKPRQIPMLRYFRVFNIEQIDGLEGKYDLPVREPFDPIERADEIIAQMPNAPTIGHGGNSAFYHPPMDAVQLPSRDQFDSIDAYYSTAFHELTHATGHKDRLNRKEVAQRTHAFGSDSYGREELVAEFGAAMVGARAGIAPLTNQSAAYIDHWLKVIKGDHKILISAAGRAQRASDYILGKNIEKTLDKTDESL
jgi:antirestriction protein ArdC